MSLTPEREAEIRAVLDDPATLIYRSTARELMAEVDRLRAEVAALREAGEHMFDVLDDAELWDDREEAMRRWREASSGEVDLEAGDLRLQADRVIDSPEGER